MLDFVDNEKILTSYRKLSRYYFDINPQETAQYIQSYKEIYDADENKFKKEQSFINCLSETASTTALRNRLLTYGTAQFYRQYLQKSERPEFGWRIDRTQRWKQGICTLSHH